MFKDIKFANDIIFDIETVPDLQTARRVYPELKAIAADDPFELLKALYKIAGATESNPEPFLKYFLHKVVSIAGMMRSFGAPKSLDNPLGVELKFFTLPGADLTKSEADIVGPFLGRVGSSQPRMIGWASSTFDLNVLTQRALINRIVVPPFFWRPNKPWEGADYFDGKSDHNFDLLPALTSYAGSSKCTLNEMCRALRIPGKLAVDGSDVARMYLDGRLADIVAYNELDVCSTYLVFLETLRCAGHVNEIAYNYELKLFREMLADRINKGGEHFRYFVQEWDALQNA